jgi:hypothetical protein
MKERIKELIAEADRKCNETRGIYDEILAELIVAECLEACSRANEIRHFVPPTQEQVVLSCMHEIETTFRS